MKNEIKNINELDQRDVELFEKIHKINLVKLFTRDGMESLILKIQNEVKDIPEDISTKEGRAKIISMAAKVAKCKAPIKNLATELKEESKKLIDGVNSQWNLFEKEMDKLRDEIRKPVDEIEVEEKRILQEKHDRLDQLQAIINPFVASSVAGCQELMQDLENVFNFNWGDFKFKAEEKFNQAKNYLQSQLEKNIKIESQQAELAQLKKEKEEREKKDREEQIAREAVEKARIEAEAREKRIEQEKIDAENRAKEAERLRIEQAEIAERNRIFAEKKAKEDAEKAIAEAIERERNRVETEKRKEAEALEKREASKRHRNKIENAIFEQMKQILLMENNLFNQEIIINEECLKAIIRAVADNLIPNLNINY